MREMSFPFLEIPRSGKINEDLAHEAGANGIEMGPILPVDAIHLYQQRLARAFSDES
jgi:hypothetical protein